MSTIFMGIGYAAINSVTGEIDVRTTANVQSGVFITSVEPVNVDADDDFITSQIKYYIGTMMQSTVALSKTDSESDIQYKVTFYNNSTESSIFLGVEYVEDYEEFYDNLGITFEISGINVGDEIGVCVTEADNTHEYADGSYNIRATYNGSSWVMDQKVILTDKAAKVRAYYPYDSEAMYGHLDINLNAVDGADDYLVGSATATVDMNSPVAHIEFKHILTRLTLAISCSEGEHLLNSVLLRSASNTLWAVASYSLLYGSDYAYNGGRSKDKHYIKKEVNATVNETRPQTVDILVYPIEGEEGDYMLEVTLDGKPYIIYLHYLVYFSFLCNNQ